MINKIEEMERGYGIENKNLEEKDILKLLIPDLIIICGGKNTDKKELLQKMKQELEKKLTVTYVDGKTWKEETIVVENAKGFMIKMAKSMSYKKKYNDVDIVIIEEISTLENNKTTEKKLIEMIKKEHKTVILSSSVPIEDLKVDEELKNLLTRGKKIEIEYPSFTKRLEFINKFLKGRTLEKKMNKNAKIYLAHQEFYYKDLENIIENIEDYQVVNNLKRISTENIESMIERYKKTR